MLDIYSSISVLVYIPICYLCIQVLSLNQKFREKSKDFGKKAKIISCRGSMTFIKSYLCCMYVPMYYNYIIHIYLHFTYLQRAIFYGNYYLELYNPDSLYFQLLIHRAVKTLCTMERMPLPKFLRSGSR